MGKKYEYNRRGEPGVECFFTDDHEDRYALPEDMRAELLNEALPQEALRSKPGSPLKPTVTRGMIDHIVSELDQIDNLAGRPKIVARKIANSTFLKGIDRLPAATSHGAIIRAITEEQGRLPSDEF